MSKKRDIAILGFTGPRRDRPTGVVIAPSFEVDEEEENRIMREDDD